MSLSLVCEDIGPLARTPIDLPYAAAAAIRTNNYINFSRYGYYDLIVYEQACIVLFNSFFGDRTANYRAIVPAHRTLDLDLE